MHLVHDIHQPSLLQGGFVMQGKKGHWHTYRMQGEEGAGTYSIYSPDGSYAITIHDFTLFKDLVMNFESPEYLSMTWYDSLSGEALYPYRRLKRGFIRGFASQDGYHALVHKNIPIYSVGVEITPEYVEKYMRSRHPKENVDLRNAFLSIDESSEFPEMVFLMHQIKNYTGEGMAAELFYEGKVHEAMALLMERAQKTKPPVKYAQVSAQDAAHLSSAASFINDHCTHTIKLETLAQIACMSPTKLKRLFRQQHGVTITEYTQQRRIGRAEAMLADTDLPIATVALSVGYRSASRFSHLFQQYTGLLPSEYRDLTLSKTKPKNKST